MTKISILLTVLFVLSLLFTGCPEDAAPELTAEEVDLLAQMPVGNIMLVGWFYQVFTEAGGGEAGATAVEALGDGISATVEATGVAITFSETQLEPSPGMFVTLDGVLSISTGVSSVTYGYSNLAITAVMNEGEDPVTVTATGTMVVSASSFTATFTLSGLTAEPADVVAEVELDEYGFPSSVVEGTINGEDYTAEFNAVLDDFGELH